MSIIIIKVQQQEKEKNIVSFGQDMKSIKNYIKVEKKKS